MNDRNVIFQSEERFYCNFLTNVSSVNYCQNEKEKPDNSHCNDVGETQIYQRQKIGT